MARTFFRRPVALILGAAICVAASTRLLAVDAPAPKAAAHDSLFQPADFPSLGKLVVAKDKTITFNTGTKDAGPEISGVITGNGALGVTKGGQVQVAVFAFDSIELDAGAKIEITGDRGLVLLAKGAVAIDTTIDLSGQRGSNEASRKKADGTTDNKFGKGGPGGEGGERGKSLNSNPPPAEHGDGGPGRKDNGEPGHGIGAGYNQRVKGGTPGGGGAYGGAGGASSEGSGGAGAGPRVMPGGAAYGDAALTELLGGSGGAGASNDRAFTSAGGGGGGGSVSIVSLASITLGAEGKILATGGAGGLNRGCGGGGSGGAILLAAPDISLIDGALLDTSGGAGGDGGKEVAKEIKPEIGRRQYGSGGGGGGGRIALYSKVDFGAPGKGKQEPKPPKGISVNGGAGGSMARDGEAGSFFDGEWPALK